MGCGCARKRKELALRKQAEMLAKQTARKKAEEEEKKNLLKRKIFL